MLLAVAKGQAGMLLASGLPTFQRTSADAGSSTRRMAMRLEGLGLTARGRQQPDPESDDEKMPLTQLPSHQSDEDMPLTQPPSQPDS